MVVKAHAEQDKKLSGIRSDQNGAPVAGNGNAVVGQARKRLCCGYAGSGLEP